MDAVRQEMRDAFQQMRQNGGFDRQAMRDMRDKMTAKMNEILTPEQQKKMEELRSQRRGRFGRGGGRGRGGPNPARLRQEAVKALNLNEEASAVVLPVLDKILAAQTAARESLRTQQQALQQKAAGDVTTDELKAQLDAFRKARKDAQDKLASARAELQELLTLQQEAKLVALGILD
jgi:Spy/CpxP family protein refolding chaperone